MKIFELIKEDFNSYNLKSNILFFYMKNPGFQCCCWFRICNQLWASKSKILIKIAHLVYRHKEIKYGIQIDYRTKIGKGFSIHHYNGIVVNINTVIGEYCSIRNNVTIGEKNGKSPIIGNNVFIGPNSCIIGGIKIGDNSIVGAGSVVVKSFDNNSIIGGNPAKLINKENNDEN